MSYATPRKNLYSNPSVLYGDIPSGDYRAPIPGWGMNPYWAGPSRVGVGAADAAPEGSRVFVGNPATMNCVEKHGGVPAMDPDGRTARCVFPNGSSCEEWALFRGECQPKGDFEAWLNRHQKHLLIGALMVGAVAFGVATRKPKRK